MPLFFMKICANYTDLPKNKIIRQSRVKTHPIDEETPLCKQMHTHSVQTQYLELNSHAAETERASKRARIKKKVERASAHASGEEIIVRNEAPRGLRNSRITGARPMLYTRDLMPRRGTF